MPINRKGQRVATDAEEMLDNHVDMLAHEIGSRQADLLKDYIGEALSEARARGERSGMRKAQRALARACGQRTA